MAEEQITEIPQRQGEPTGEGERSQAQGAEMEGERAALNERLARTVARYRTVLLAGSPEVPEEMVKGETVEEVDRSLASAKELVERVRKQLEARGQAERVPAGAPPRRRPDLSALSPQEKIAYGLARR